MVEQRDEAQRIVLAWQEAVNGRDEARLREFSDPQIAIVGPRGIAHGFDVLVDWLRRAGLNLITQRTFARGEAVVLAQHGVWRTIDDGAVRGEADVASYFRVIAGRVAHYERRDTLAEALAAAGLTEEEEVRKA